MDRRDALKSLVAIPGLTVTPVTVKEAEEAALIVLKTPDHMTQEGAARLKTYWDHAVEGTPLQGVRTVGRAWRRGHRSDPQARAH